MIDRQAVGWDELASVLVETAGAQAIEELALVRSLRQEIARQGVSLDSHTARQEEQLLADSISQDGTLTARQSSEVIRELRKNRGLGPVRYQLLLERNAMLRALVQDDVILNETSLRTAFAVRHGPRREVRLIVAPTQRKAATLRDRLTRVPPANARSAFIQSAIEHSTDPTAPRGGLTEPISPLDPAYAPAIRRVLQSLEPAQISPVIAVENGFAIMLLERDLPADSSTFESVRDELQAFIRLRQERLLMDRLARRLLDATPITVFDESLNWAWKNRRSR